MQITVSTAINESSIIVIWSIIASITTHACIRDCVLPGIELPIRRLCVLRDILKPYQLLLFLNFTF